MSSRRKILFGVVGFYLISLVGILLIFGFTRRDNEEFQPQNEFKLDSWVNLPGPFDINKAVLYLVIAGITIERRAARAGDYKTALGLNMASLVLRAWLIGLTILAVGLIADREDGLTAGITVLAAFTVYFATSLILRPLERKPPRP